MNPDALSLLTKPRPLSAPISLAVDFYNRYPGEIVTYFLRFSVPTQPGAFIQLSLPKVMQVSAYQISGETALPALRFAETDQELLVILNLQPPLQAGREYVLELQARVNTFQFDQHLLAEAILLDSDTHPLARESLQVAVRAKSEYLQYLPEIYQSDDFTSRFLMLIESFWKPISRQIDQTSHYFDPDLTPAELLPWLSSWVGLRQDMNLPVSRVRTLLQKGVMLFQYRGTLYALKTYLETITAGKVQIREQRASNLVLGKGSALGVGVALGQKNQPNTLSVRIEAPAAELTRLGYTPEMYRRKMAAIIRTLVPAHVFFDIDCTFTKSIQPEEQA
jgi:phage tail-like protein